MTSVTIPSSVTFIGNYAFADCGCLTGISVPNSVTSIGEGAFWGCAVATSINIPENLTSIEPYVFFNCPSLTSFTIPNGVTNVGEFAFEWCNMTDVYCYAENVPNTNSNAFENSSISTATLHVPAGSIDVYRGTEPWSSFGTIVTIGKNIEDLSELSNNKQYLIHTRNKTRGSLGVFANHLASTISSATGPWVCRPIALDKDNPLITSVDQLSSPYTEPTEGSLAAMIDGNTDTFWHSNWSQSGDDVEAGTHYFQVEIANPTDIDVAFQVTRRQADNDHITEWGVYGTNNANASKEECTSLAVIETPYYYKDETRVSDIFSTGGYQYLRFYIERTTRRNFGHLAEFQLYPATNDEAYADASPFAIIKKNDNFYLYSVRDKAFITSQKDGDESAYPLGKMDIYERDDHFVFDFIDTGYTINVNDDRGIYVCDYGTMNNTFDDGNLFIIEEVGDFDPTEALAMFEGNGEGNEAIAFADAKVKALCVANWDFNGDGELNLWEAALVKSLGTVFKDNTEITSFDELQYFTGLTSIGSSAFSYSSLTSITIPNSVISIYRDAFDWCMGLTSITIPQSVTYIAGSTFQGCQNLTSIIVEEGNPTYDSRDNCNAIIETAKNTLIAGCQNTIIPESVTSIGGCAFEGGCTGPTTFINIPDGVTSIGEWGFHGCGLTSVTIPNSVTRIDYAAFQYCDLMTDLTIGSGVTNIGSLVFDGCSALTDVWCCAENVPSAESNAFNNTPIASATLHVPAASLEAYSTTAPWSGFGTIVPIEEPGIEVTDISQLDNVIYIEPMEENTGSEVAISIKMKNTASIRGFQFDLVLPEGVSPVVEDGVILCGLNKERSPQNALGTLYHTIEASRQDDGSYRILCGSQQAKTFLGNDGEVAVLYVNIASDMATGDYPVILKNIKLTETDINYFYETEELLTKLTVEDYIIGDINGDRAVDVSDYIGVANHILGNTPSGFNYNAADVNHDGAIDVSDYIGIANIILTGSIYGTTNGALHSLGKKDVRDPQ